jgi:2-keto-4-pentenoate hydratase
MQSLNIDAPLVGYLLVDNQLPNEAVVSVSGWTNPKVETEIAAHLIDDIPAGASDVQIGEAVGGLSLAFELVDASPPPTDPVDILSHNIFQRHVIVGAPAPLGAAPPVTIEVNGRAVATAVDPQVVVGRLEALVGHVADVLDGAESGLRAGDVIITGMVVPAMEMRVSDSFRATAVGLEPLRFSVGR